MLNTATITTDLGSSDPIPRPLSEPLIADTPPPSLCQRVKNCVSRYIREERIEAEKILGPRTLKNVSFARQTGWTEWGTFGRFLVSPKKWIDRDNPYVTEMWSPEFFLKTKSDLTTMKLSCFRLIDSLVAIFSELSTNNSFTENGKALLLNTAIFFKEILCFTAMLIQSTLNYIINIDGLNFLKGAVGVIYSTLHFVVSVVLGLIHLGGGILFWDGDLIREANRDLLNAGYDLLSLAACIGHAIPSWAPIAIAAFFPHVAVALAIAKIGEKTIGLPDIIGYGSTLLLLKLEIMRTPPGEKREQLQKRYSHMMSELNPGKSMEGKLIAGAATHMVGEATESALSFFVGEPIAKIAKYCIYGIGAGATAFATVKVMKKKGKQEAQSRPIAAEVTRIAI